MRRVWRGMLDRSRRRWRFRIGGIRDGRQTESLSHCWACRKERAQTEVCATVFRTLLFLEKRGRAVVTSKWCLRQGANRRGVRRFQMSLGVWNRTVLNEEHRLKSVALAAAEGFEEHRLKSVPLEER